MKRSINEVLTSKKAINQENATAKKKSIHKPAVSSTNATTNGHWSAGLNQVFNVGILKVIPTFYNLFKHLLSKESLWETFKL